MIWRIVLLLFLFLPQPFFSAEIQGRVPGVCDGEPITVLNKSHAEAIRLNRIDCPEKGQDLGATDFDARAKQFNSDLCFGS